MRRFALAGALALALMMSAHAADGPVLRIDGDEGGAVEVYRTVLNFMRMLGARAEISGECVSACVMVLKSFPKDRICIREGARIGLHQVAFPGPNGKPRYDKRATDDFVRRFYPAWIGAWIARTGPLKPKLVFIEFAELRKHYAECQG